MSEVDHPTLSDPLDVFEAGEALAFMSGWLAGASPEVVADLYRHLGTDDYPISELVADLARLAVALGVGEDDR